MTFIKAKTVDSILSTFTKAVADLNVLAGNKFREAELLSDAAIKLEAQSDEANAEGNRALAAAVKIKSITE
jgi:hypothetical protein